MEKKRIDLWTWVGEGEGEICGKSNMESYVSKIDSQQ